MRGVILAGGTGSRLMPLTTTISKHCLPVGQFPMIFYPLKKLVGAGISDILIVSSREHAGQYSDLLGSGREHGCQLTYRVQDAAGGIAQALGLAEGFCRGERMCVVLGDNIFEDTLSHWNAYPHDMATIFLKSVDDPERYGVAEMSADSGWIVSIEEKPKEPKSHWAIAGIYVYPPDVFDIIKTLRPSSRGELEVSDINREYLRRQKLAYCLLHGYWTDAGTHESLAEACRLVRETPPRF